ncbi:hypothetical protein QYF61_004896 [Mycteria americana]|uniref:Uncharacterized protein n=1 Tax=Mycteria americana TaxID=33587 RepID=A0AAN7MKF9_MYCAM|nr:hypothetical protein QYF61_004893 [Mycteria americana]KAK4808443.1 hypothetical protein QYF61_004896 [Mycteria americana]
MKIVLRKQRNWRENYCDLLLQQNGIQVCEVGTPEPLSIPPPGRDLSSVNYKLGGGGAGGDRILLSDNEARGFWGPGVLLSDGPAGDQSITLRVAYWAGGVDTKEIVRVSGRSTKAVCVQAMYEWGQQGIPMAALVDPRHLRPLIRGLPDALKIHVQSLRERIQKTIEHSRPNPQNLLAHILTWARDVTQYSHLGARDGRD